MGAVLASLTPGATAWAQRTGAAAPEAAMGMPRAHSAGVTSLDENGTAGAKAKAILV